MNSHPQFLTRKRSMLLSEPQLAEMLNLSISWVQRARFTGEGPPFIKIKHAVRYRKVDVERWIEERIQTSTSDNGGNHA